MLTIITGCVLAILGVALIVGGVWLTLLSGTWVYIGLGVGLLLTGILLALRRRAALGVYALLLIGVIIWALGEVGFDRWDLIPRGAFFAVVGLWLLAPWIYWPTHRPHLENAAGRSSWLGPRGGLAVVMAAVVAIAVFSIFQDPFNVAGSLPPAPSAATVQNANIPDAAGKNWLAYGGTGYGERYSSLTQITPRNAGKLKLAWTFHTGDKRGPKDPVETTFEDTPLEVNGTLYLCSVHQHVIALDAATGKPRWQFDPHIKVGHTSQHLTCRGLAYYDATKHAAPPAAATTGTTGANAPSTAASSTPPTAAPAASTAACTRRIFLATIDARLIALDAATGKPCAGFSDNGTVNLDTGMPNLKPGYYMETSPPVVAGHLLIIGGSINDNESVNNPSGVIRAFDIDSGRLVWNFDSGNPNRTAPLPAGQHYTAGAPNNWAPGSVDKKLGLVYFGLGNQSPDQLDANRGPAVNRLSSSIIALDVASGQLRWVFQGVHHDLWDRDIPAQPSLIDLTIGGKPVPALVAPTKQGDLYVLDRRSGKPVLPAHEEPAPDSAMPDQKTSPTQPVSSLSFTPPPLTGKDMWGATPFDQLICRIEFKSMNYEGPYTPPSTTRTLVYPGNLGVFNWGGVAVDPVRQILIGTPAHLAFTFQLIPRHDKTTNYVSADKKEHWNENYGGRYAVMMGPFLSPLNLPCQEPPWGAIAGVDLRTGKVAWMHRDGTTQDKMPDFLPIPFPMGVASLGGPLITAGGIAFYSGTLDDYLRAYDMTTGRELWQARLPAGGQATPMTYSVNGKQFVVVAAGGHGSFGTRAGDAVLAYALK